MIDRKFGVELEIVGISKELAIRALAAVDIEAHDAGYTHMTTRDWKIVSDASVHRGFELVSPVLEGEEGLETLRTAAQALADAGATANRSCGLHVHIDAHGRLRGRNRRIHAAEPPGQHQWLLLFCPSGG